MLQMFARMILCAITICAFSAILTSKDFIPADKLWLGGDFSSATLSPCGNHLIGRALKLHDDRAGGDWVFYELNMQTRAIQALHTQETRNNRAVEEYHWIGGDRFAYHLQGYGAGEDMFFRSLEWEDIKRSAILFGNAATDLNEGLGDEDGLADAVLVDPLIDDPDHVLVAIVSKAERLDGKNRRYIQEPFNQNGVFKVNVVTNEAELVVIDRFNAAELVSSNGRPRAAWYTDTKGQVRLVAGNMSLQFDKEGEPSNVSAWEDLDFEQRQQVLASEYHVLIDGEWKKLPFDGTWGGGLAPNDFFKPSFSPDGMKILYFSGKDADTSELRAFNLETWQIEKVKSHPRVDLAIWDADFFGVPSVLMHPHRRELLGIMIHDGIPKPHYFDEKLSKLHAMVDKLLVGRVNLLSSWSEDMRKIVVQSYASDVPAEYFFIDLDAKQVEEVHATAPWLVEYEFNKTQPISYQARDGLQIDGYLTTPSNPRAKAPYPTILLVHGGPWARDYYRFDREVQFYADRGYAVLQVNFRGSDGYGIEFMEKGRMEWGRKMQDDLVDGVKWAIEQGHTDPDRVVICGASYGGYAAAMGATRDADLFAASIVSMAPTDLIDFIADDYHYGVDWRGDEMKLWLGDPDENPDFLREVSPLFLVNRVKAPVLIYHGDDDARVGVAHALRFARALRKASDHEVVLHTLTDAQHNFGDEEKRALMFTRFEEFLRRHVPSDLM